MRAMTMRKYPNVTIVSRISILMIARPELKMTTNDLKYARKVRSLANFVLSIAKKSDLVIIYSFVIQL
jgi:hypothetical protein